MFLHFHPLHLDTPWVSSLIQGGLHVVRDLLPLREHLGKALGSNDIPEQENGRVILIIPPPYLSVVAASKWVECL